MKTLSPQAQAAVLSRFTKPGYLIAIEMAESDTMRLSTIGTVAWGGSAWIGDPPVTVTGFSLGPVGVAVGGVSIGNATGVAGAVFLNQSSIGVRVKIWVCDAEAVGDPDPVNMFDGYVDSFDVTIDAVNLTLSNYRAGSMKGPRRYVEKASGFNVLIPAGSSITFGSQSFKIERRK